MKNNLVLETPQLLLESTQAEWLDSILKIEQSNQQYIGASPKEKHLEFINGAVEIHLSILRKEDRQLVGYIILVGVNSPDKSMLLKRIAIAEKGKGYGRECLQAVKQFCFDQLRFHRLWLDVYTYNERAIHLYETEGFQREGVMRECSFKDGTYHDLILLSLLESEYITINS